MAAPLAPNQVAARLDRLPVGWFHYRFLALISMGAWFDYYDNFVASTLAVILPRAGVLPQPQPGEWVSAVGLFTATLPLGMFLGSLFLGIASDYLGRRFSFIAMLLLYSVATLAGGAGYYPLTAVAGTWTGLLLLFVSRLLAGVGIGAENVIIDAYVSEVMPRQIRGRRRPCSRRRLHGTTGCRALGSFARAQRIAAGMVAALGDRLRGSAFCLVFPPPAPRVAALVRHRRAARASGRCLGRYRGRGTAPDGSPSSPGRDTGSRANTAVPFLGDLVSPLSRSDRDARRVPPAANRGVLRLHALARRSRAAQGAGIQPGADLECRRVRAGAGRPAARRLVQRALAAEAAHRGSGSGHRCCAVAVRFSAEPSSVGTDGVRDRCWTKLVLGGFPRLPGGAFPHGSPCHRRGLHLCLEPDQHGCSQCDHARSHCGEPAGGVWTHGHSAVRRGGRRRALWPTDNARALEDI